MGFRFVIVTLLFLLVVAGCGAKSASKAPPAGEGYVVPSATVSPSSGWVTVGKWTGTTTKTTQRFQVPSEWRISWQFAPSSRSDCLMIYPQTDATTFQPLSPFTATEAGSDITYLHNGGVFWLQIIATGRYTIEVQTPAR